MGTEGCTDIAEWSSPEARWAHNPKVVGSNPASATIKPSDSFELDGFLYIKIGISFPFISFSNIF